MIYLDIYLFHGVSLFSTRCARGQQNGGDGRASVAEYDRGNRKCVQTAAVSLPYGSYDVQTSITSYPVYYSFYIYPADFEVSFFVFLSLCFLLPCVCEDLS